MSQTAVDYSQVESIAQHLMNTYPPEYLRAWAEQHKYMRYQQDPVGFGRMVLKERYTPDVVRLMESVRDHNVTIAISANATGKTFCAASLAWWHYLCFPNSITITASAPPLDNLKRLLWGEIAKKITKNKEILEGSVFNVMRIARTDWNYIVGVAIPQSGPPEERTAKFSGKHAENLMFICDESDAIDIEIFTGISNCMSGGNVKLLCMFNPKLMSGWVWQQIRDNRANVVHLTAFDHINVQEGQNIFPGAVTREITVKRINECSMPLYHDEEPDQYCFEVPDFLVGTVASNDKGDEYPPLLPGWRRVTERRFFHQVLGRFGPQGENQLIQKDWVDKARFRWDDYVSRFGEKPPELVRPVLGLDISDTGDDSSALCKRYGDWVAPFERWKGISPNESADRVAAVAQFLKSSDVKVDSIGVGADVQPLIRKQGVKASKVVASEKPTKTYKQDGKDLKFNKLRDQICWETAEWFSSDSAMIPPDEKLIEECLVLTYETDKTTGRLRVLSKDNVRKLLGRSPDTFDSLALTFAPKSRAPKIYSMRD